MEKRRMGPQHFLNPKPVALVGTIVDEFWIGGSHTVPPQRVQKRGKLAGLFEALSSEENILKPIGTLVG